MFPVQKILSEGQSHSETDTDMSVAQKEKRKDFFWYVGNSEWNFGDN